MKVVRQVGWYSLLVSLVALSLTGFLLGGTPGIGTLVFALGVGPAVEFGFRVFGVPSRVGPTPTRQGGKQHDHIADY